MSRPLWKSGLVLVAFLAAVWGLAPSAVRACTIGVVSGKATEDGRPLLWKNRDTNSRRNIVEVFSDGKYRQMAVIDAGKPNAIWMGMNEAGLCLANSLSLDLPGGHTTGRGNGRFMKLALESCASVAEFEQLLLETNQTGRRTRANFGAIDAHGAAALFEAGHRSFIKYDANDPKTAPQGFLVRSNFSMSQTLDRHRERPEDVLKLYSGRRYLRADGLVRHYLSRHGQLDYRFFLQDLSRDIAQAIDSPANDFKLLYASHTPGEVGLSLPASIDTQSTINRQNTVSAVVFHGVRADTAPQWTTMWTLLGEPAFSVAVPCWITAEHPSASLCGPDSLCTIASEVREMNYDSKTLLSTRWLGRIWAETLPVENRIIQQTADRMRLWRKNKKLPQADEVAGFHESLAQSAVESLRKVQALIGSQPALAEKPVRDNLLAVKPKTSPHPATVGE